VTRGGEQRVLAAEACPARRDNEVLDVARDQRGVGIEAEDEAFSFSAVVEHVVEHGPFPHHRES
jgi:hypothetical protein